jgi:hypothetical protein
MIGILAITRWIPAPLHRALDAWSRKLAARRRQRRLRLARQGR